ncbi:MAG: VOC family protein [Candidatus Liptonbacteria bacterium]|nr:VOC family protein [Candidatus Liptonbacteria bacterium]
MNKNKVTNFEVPISDFKKAKDFYGKVFDWEFKDWGDEGFEARTTASDNDGHPTEPGGINGGFYKRKSPNDRPSMVIQTDSIDETIKKIEQAGGKVTAPKHKLGEWGFMADFTDPEGNEFALWESAKK